MRKALITAILIVACFALATNAFAQPYDPTMTADGYEGSPDAIPTPNEGGGNPEIYQALNQLLGTSLTSNADADPYFVQSPNSFWFDLGGGTAGAFAAIGLTAGNLNTIQVYNVLDPLTQIPVLGPYSGFGFLGDGSMADPYPAGVNPFVSGENFGFTLLSDNGSTSTLWDSNPANNVDSLDHMLAYYLPSLAGSSIYIDLGSGPELFTFTSDTYLLAWEDLASGDSEYDADYNDAIYVVTRVAPVPEPASMMLLGSGLLGLAGIRRKKA